MTKLYLECTAAEAAALNTTGLGYPKAGTPGPGGLLSATPGGVGWTVREDGEVVDPDDADSHCIRVDDSRCDTAKKAKLKTRDKVKKKLLDLMDAAGVP